MNLALQSGKLESSFFKRAGVAKKKNCVNICVVHIIVLRNILSNKKSRGVSLSSRFVIRYTTDPRTEATDL